MRLRLRLERYFEFKQLGPIGRPKSWPDLRHSWRWRISSWKSF